MSWFVIFATIAVLHPIVVGMKKRVPIAELYTTVLFALFMQSLVDTFASYTYKAWGFYDPGIAELRALWIILGIYPAYAAIIANGYPFRAAKWRKGLYLLGWSAFSTAYEWLTMKVGIMWHLHWNLLYSFLLYPVLYYLLPLHIRIYRRLQLRGK